MSRYFKIHISGEKDTVKLRTKSFVNLFLSLIVFSGDGHGIAVDSLTTMLKS